jgi:hypothetical protein
VGGGLLAAGCCNRPASAEVLSDKGVHLVLRLAVSPAAAAAAAAAATGVVVGSCLATAHATCRGRPRRGSSSHSRFALNRMRGRGPASSIFCLGAER